MTPTSSSELTAAPGGPAAGGPIAQNAIRPRRARAVGVTILRKVGAALVVLWGAATVAFFAQLALPGDRATTILNIRAGQAQARTPEEVASPPLPRAIVATLGPPGRASSGGTGLGGAVSVFPSPSVNVCPSIDTVVPAGPLAPWGPFAP